MGAIENEWKKGSHKLSSVKNLVLGGALLLTSQHYSVCVCLWLFHFSFLGGVLTGVADWTEQLLDSLSHNEENQALKASILPLLVFLGACWTLIDPVPFHLAAMLGLCQAYADALWHLLKANWSHVRPSSLYVGSMLRLFHLLGNRFGKICLFQEHRKYTFLDQTWAQFRPCRPLFRRLLSPMSGHLAGLLCHCCAYVAFCWLLTCWPQVRPCQLCWAYISWNHLARAWSRPGCLPVLMPAGRKRRRGFGSAGLAG